MAVSPDTKHTRAKPKTQKALLKQQIFTALLSLSDKIYTLTDLIMSKPPVPIMTNPIATMLKYITYSSDIQLLDWGLCDVSSPSVWKEGRSDCGLAELGPLLLSLIFK